MWQQFSIEWKNVREGIYEGKNGYIDFLPKFSKSQRLWWKEISPESKLIYM